MTLDDVVAEVHAQLPDNDQQLITPQRLRAVLLLLVRAIREGIDQ